LTIFATGETVYHCLIASDRLAAAGITARVIDMPTIKPLDKSAVLRAAEETGAIVTVEEHSILGGLGAAVAELVVQNQPVPMRIIGFPDEFVPAGSSSELFDHYGLTDPNLASSIEAFLKRLRPG
jgi:transketolase